MNEISREVESFFLVSRFSWPNASTFAKFCANGERTQTAARASAGDPLNC